MYHVSTQGADERTMNVHYYYLNRPTALSYKTEWVAVVTAST